MTNDEKRIAIAEICGVLNRPKCKPSIEQLEAILASNSKLEITILPNGEVRSCPNYPEDLNACHDMEKTLLDTKENDQWSTYCVHLNAISCRLKCGNMQTCGYTISATAAQRCDAFLLTHGFKL